MISKLIVILLLGILVSCSLFIDEEKYSEPVGVDLLVTNKVHESDGSSINVDKIGNKNVYGPLGDYSAIERKSTYQARKTVAIILGPGLGRTVSYASMLTKLKKNNTPFDFIIGTGYGALVAAMYASGMTGSKVEWCFYNFFNATKGQQAFSKDWNEAANKYLITPIQGNKIEEFDKVLVIPIWDGNKKILQYSKRGDLKKALALNLRLFAPSSQHTNFEYYNKTYFEKIGVDISVGINILKNVKFAIDKSKRAERYNEVFSVLEATQSNVDIYFMLPVVDMFLDSSDKVPEVLLKSYEDSEKLSSIIIERLSF